MDNARKIIPGTVSSKPMESNEQEVCDWDAGILWLIWDHIFCCHWGSFQNPDFFWLIFWSHLSFLLLNNKNALYRLLRNISPGLGLTKSSGKGIRFFSSPTANLFRSKVKSQKHSSSQLLFLPRGLNLSSSASFTDAGRSQWTSTCEITLKYGLIGDEPALSKDGGFMGIRASDSAWLP